MTLRVWPSSVSVSCPVAASHTLTVRSQPAEARRLPSGLNAKLVTPGLDVTLLTPGLKAFPCPVRMREACPVAAFHTLTGPSIPAEASRFPSGQKATLLTKLVCSLKVRVSWPAAASHTITVPSIPADVSRFPSALNATRKTGPAWPLRVRDFARSRRPTPSPSDRNCRRPTACRRG